MSLPRLRLETSLREPDGRWRLHTAESHHLEVRRCAPGDRVEGLLPGWRVLLRLEQTGDQWFGYEEGRLSETEVPVRITLLAGLLKEDAWNILLCAATEVGVARIIPLACARSVPRLVGSRLLDRMRRWRRILAEATKQCGASEIPVLEHPISVDAVEDGALPSDRFAALLSGDAVPLGRASFLGDAVAFAVGPEGDFSPDEGIWLRALRFRPVSLGARILRAPTAAVVGCAWFALARERGRISDPGTEAFEALKGDSENRGSP